MSTPAAHQAAKDAPEVYCIGRRVRTAQIAHKCFLCKWPIQAGQAYVRVACTVGGHFEVWKYHAGPRDCIWVGRRVG